MSKTFGPTYKGQHYPAEMRTQLWPLCCGAKIISGFKAVGTASVEELTKQIISLCDEAIPDHQVFTGEHINPRLTFLTLNPSQMSSKKIMEAVEEAGFKIFAQGSGHNPGQGFFVRDMGKYFHIVDTAKAAA